MPVARRFQSAKQAVPSTHLLSNGRYTVMITAAGSGYSTWNGLAVTRWREDASCDPWGSYLYLRDTESGKLWSASSLPLGPEPDHYDVNFLEDRARIAHNDGTLSTCLEILVSPEDDVELRKLSITNTGTKPREIELTSYMEVVLATKEADAAHPAFSNLFIQTEYLHEVQGLLAMRRPQSASDTALWAAHLIASGTQQDKVEYETDRDRFIGRGHSPRKPMALLSSQPLSNTVGSVLDPILSLRTRVKVAPGKSTHLVFATLVAATRDEIVHLAKKYRDVSAFDRISALASTWTQGHLHDLGITAEQAQLFQFLANRVIYCDPAARPGSDILKLNTLSATSLWRFSISGDLPIVLLHVNDQTDHEHLQQLLQAHQYWHSKNLAVDVVILNERNAPDVQDFQQSLENAVRATLPIPPPDPRQGGVFILQADLLEAPEIILLRTAARITLLDSKHGTLEEQAERMQSAQPESIAAPPAPKATGLYSDTVVLEPPAMEFFNGWGGFANGGKEYVIVLDQHRHTPAPWVNIIANPHFGFQVSESGSGYTWAVNSQENQLTPWSNDPICDPPSEVFYLRDENTGELWTPTALPIRLKNSRYLARHGRGYSLFQHNSHGIACELLQFVSWNDPVKISTLTLKNVSSGIRKLSITNYVEWILGSSRPRNMPFIITEMDAATGAMFASNPWNTDFNQQIAFVDCVGRATSWTADRTEFMGRNGNLEKPAALMTDTPLKGRTGAGMDACSVLQTLVELQPGERVEVTFLLGQARDREAARELVMQYRSGDMLAVLSEVKDRWDEILTTVQVKTPDRSMDLMLNGYLLYQVIACRLWARAAFYQVSGAYGFRDQLQDSMALNLARPDLSRAHLLRSAARQFIEGDVQHWWHPPQGRGVRTRISDDRLWLPYAVAQYVAVTGDHAVLDEIVPFLDGAAVDADQDNAYYLPAVSTQTGTLFEHCVRAIDCSLAVGAHGLPLMGDGDWNDGYNRVGHAGKGESVWLGWFLHATIANFTELALARGQRDMVQRWGKHCDLLQASLETQAWDGAWYRRAYYDDGTPLGSATSQECRIDSLAQSWSVISKTGDPARQRQAMQSLEQLLIRRADDLVLLLTPPFDQTPLDPGYIKGYVPGVRENGGQYTHAAVWCIIAYATLGDGEKAGELFSMLNPVNHASTPARAHIYKVEPYVIAGDIYSASSHIRRGGWSWYTGSAAWLYRSGVESILGLQKQGQSLTIDPCIPREWRHFELDYRYGKTHYHVTVINPQGVTKGVASIELDGIVLPSNEEAVLLVNDGDAHKIHVVMGQRRLIDH